MNPYFSTVGRAAELEQILLRREARAEEQRRLLALGGQSLISFTMNIPGACKSFPLANAAFDEGMAQIRQAITVLPLLYAAHSEHATGCEAFFLLDTPAQEVKRRCIILERSHPLGRLWDIDVLNPDGTAVSRRELGLDARRCLLCSKEAKLCARSHTHSMEEIRMRMISILGDFFCDEAASVIGRCAEHALSAEVCTTPKPGLVDQRNNGSHSDMTIGTFADSIQALSFWFPAFYRAGWACDEPQQLFQKLRALGIEAQREMYEVTGGVNTHKGSIFSFAVLCGALGALQASHRAPCTLSALQESCRNIAEHSLADFKATTPDTEGLRCYQEHALYGARGEAAQGFPSAMECALPALQLWLKRGADFNRASVAALLHLIGQIDDTNMIHRGGVLEARRRRLEAAELYDILTVDTIIPTATALDESYIRANLSPGGCADMLAVSLFLFFVLNEKIVIY